MSSIQLLKVKSNQEKLSKLCQTVKYHFDRHERLLIAVPNDEVARYLDNLLWRFPPESFLPHKVVSKESDFPIVITTTMENLNRASILINLLPGANPICLQFDTIYEIYDETDPVKENLSRERLTAYKALGCFSLKA